MPRFVALNVSSLPPPPLIETIDFEVILAALKADAKTRLETAGIVVDTLDLETEPITVVLEAAAYRETLLRAMVNDRARAVLLAYATGTDLDHIGALFATARRTINPGNPDANPPVPVVTQSDAEYREEIQLAPEAFSVSGPEGAYVYFARRAHASLMDVAALHAGENRIDVVLLSRDGSGAASPEAITAAAAALSPKTTRPLTDDVRVRSAAIVSTPVALRLQLRPGPDPVAIQTRALAAVQVHIAERRRIGLALRVDGLIGAARVAGDIERVIVERPAVDVDPGAYGAVHAFPVTVTTEILS